MQSYIVTYSRLYKREIFDNVEVSAEWTLISAFPIPNRGELVQKYSPQTQCPAIAGTYLKTKGWQRTNTVLFEPPRAKRLLLLTPNRMAQRINTYLKFKGS